MMPGLAHAPLVIGLIFLLGCLVILATRAHARAVTAVLAGAVAMLVLIGVELAFDRLGVPSGDAEAGRLFWPKKLTGGLSPGRGTASSSPSPS